MSTPTSEPEHSRDRELLQRVLCGLRNLREKPSTPQDRRVINTSTSTITAIGDPDYPDRVEFEEEED